MTPARRIVLVAGVALAACREASHIPRPVVDGGIAEQGPALFTKYGCGSCHIIPGVDNTTGRSGPSLAAFGDRVFIAGRVRNEPELLVLWLRNPQQLKPRTGMPNLELTESDARHMAAYLYTLSANRGGPPYVIPERYRPEH